MPAIADIVVKKNDAVTNITYVAQSPSSGDGVPAVWRSTSVGTSPAHAPELRLSSRDQDKGKKRALRGSFVYPQISTNTTTGVTSVVQKSAIMFDVTMPKDMVQSDINEACAQFGNLLASALIQSCLKAGYSAT
jgi:hypothetical protein